MSLLNVGDATARPVYYQEKLPQELMQVVYAVSGYLHHTQGTPPCDSSRPCEPCKHAVRLVAQVVVPMVAEEILGGIESRFGRHCRVPHPGSDDD